MLVALAAHRGSVSIAQLSERAALHADDVLETLQALGLLHFRKGQHTIKAHPDVIRKCVTQLRAL